MSSIAESALDPESPDNPGSWRRADGPSAGWGGVRVWRPPRGTREAQPDHDDGRRSRRRWIEEPAGGLARIEVSDSPRGGAASRAKIEDGPMSKHGTLRENRPLVLSMGPEGAASSGPMTESTRVLPAACNVNCSRHRHPSRVTRGRQARPRAGTNIRHYRARSGGRGRSSPNWFFLRGHGLSCSPTSRSRPSVVVTRREAPGGTLSR